MSKGSKSFVAYEASAIAMCETALPNEPLKRFEHTMYLEATTKHIARIIVMLFAFASSMTAQVTTCKNFENIRCVDSANAAGWSGTDFVGWVNSAYADCPSTGCDIYIAAGSYTSSSTTGILITTNNKPARLLCPAAGAAKLNFTATTATAITFNFSAGNLSAAGINGCQLTGPGSSTASTGIVLGGSNGASQVVLRDAKVQTFGTFESVSNNAFNQECDHCVILQNGIGFSILSGVSNSGESFHFTHSVIGGTTSNPSVCLAITASVNNFTFDGGSLDQCSFSITSGQINISNTHFENPSGLTSSPLFVNAGGRVVLDNPDFQWDSSSAPSPSTAVQCTSGILIVKGASFFSPNTTLASNFSLSGSCEFHEQGTKLSSGFTSFLANVSTGPVSSFGNVWGNNQLLGAGALVMSGSTLQLGPAGGNLYSIAPVNPATARTLSIMDPGANSSFVILVASGTSTLGNTSIASGSCATTVTTSAANVAGTDSIKWSYASFPAPVTDGRLILNAFTSAGHVNFSLCNPTSGAIVPSGLTVNWRISR